MCTYKRRYETSPPCPNCEVARDGFWTRGSEWLHQLVKTKRPNTVSSYRSCLRKYGEVFRSIGYEAEADLRADPIALGLAEEAYREGLAEMKSGLMSKTVGAQRYNQALVVLRRYLVWRNRTEPRATPLNLWAVFDEDFQKQKTAGKERDFDPDEVWRRINQLDTRMLSDDGFCLGLRDAAFLAFLLGTGVRPGHAAILTSTDVDLRKKVAYLPEFKQTIAYKVLIHPAVIPLLRRWREEKDRTASRRYNDTDLFFHGARGGPLRRNDWVALVERHGLRTGWKSNTRTQFSLNCLRSTYGSWALNQGRASIGEVQGLLGHTSSETTSKYYARYNLRSLGRVVSRMQLKPLRKSTKPRRTQRAGRK